MLNKLVFIVLDGLCYSEAEEQMGFLNHLVEKSVGDLYKVKSEMPSMSRPLYETILTGVPPYKSGIVNNKITRLSNNKSIFHLVKDAGGQSCAAAYHWISELYNTSPFDYINHCYQEDDKKPIQYGRFYFEDDYPDSHLFVDAEMLRKKHGPDFLYIHPMGIDYVGHKYGRDSREYRTKVIETDIILSNFIPKWMDEGYDIIVTSDHGMNKDGNHCGNSGEERSVPLFYFGNKELNILKEKEIEQRYIAAIVCRILNIEKSEHMEEYR